MRSSPPPARRAPDLDVRAAFDAAASGYDALRRQLIPCFDDFYAAVVDWLPFRPGAAPRILDLGAGTGLLSALLLARWPRARLDLVDLSPEMAAQARLRFAGREDRVRVREADYLVGPPGGPYDAVVSALSIHHLPDGAKRAVFRRALASLRPGGWFIDADNVLAPSPALAADDRSRWIARVRESGIAQADLAEALRRTRLDVLAPLSSQLRWLRAAGFVDVDCRYKWLHFAVFGGRRPVGTRPVVRRARDARPRPSRHSPRRSARRRAGA